MMMAPQPEPAKKKRGRPPGPMTGEQLAAHRERMRRLNADPEFAAKNAERGRERMRRLHADPEFAAKNAERMRRLNADPEFAAKNAERGRERMRRLNADPEFAAKLKLARTCDFCMRVHSSQYPVVRMIGDDGSVFHACKREEDCGGPTEYDGCPCEGSLADAAPERDVRLLIVGSEVFTWPQGPRPGVFGEPRPDVAGVTEDAMQRYDSRPRFDAQAKKRKLG